MVRFLVSAFDPFDGRVENQSAKVIAGLAEGPGFEISKVVIPTSTHRAFPLLQESMLMMEFDYIILLGEADRPYLSLEKVALNYADFSIPDNDGVMLTDQKISPAVDSKEALFSHLDLKKIAKSLNDQKMNSKVSLSAGSYVCNYVYFQTLDSLLKAQSGAQGLFVHVPILWPETDANQSASKSASAVQKILEHLADS